MTGKRGTPEQRFWNHVQIGPGCWLWTGAVSKSGYGKLWLSRESNWFAHRFSWFLHFGEIKAGLLVCHKCDERACVNPGHLFLGTSQDNTDDMLTKGRGRWPQGPKPKGQPLRKLDQDKISKIRLLLDGGATQAEVAREYGLSQFTVSKVHRRVAPYL